VDTRSGRGRHPAAGAGSRGFPPAVRRLLPWPATHPGCRRPRPRAGCAKRRPHLPPASTAWATRNRAR